MLLWLVLIARCSGSDEIPLGRAEQSSNYSSDIAANAIDGDLRTGSRTTRESPAWLRVHFTSSSTVDKVVVESGHSNSAACLYRVSVYYKGSETICGTYTKEPG